MGYEPLKNQKQKIKKEFRQTKNIKNVEEKELCQSFDKGVDNSFDLFANFIDMYNKYKNNVKLLMNDHNDIWSKWVKYYENKSNIDNSNYLFKYNEWLFNYLFSDVNGNTTEFLDVL